MSKMNGCQTTRDRPIIVAVCGIDGAGKTTLVSRLKNDARFGDVEFVCKKKRKNVEVLVEHFPHFDRNPNSYLEGFYAEAIRWGHAFDFLTFFEEEILHLYGTTRMIISDRWSLCSIAYADTGVKLAGPVANVLAAVPEADMVVFLDVSPEVAIERIAARENVQGDEDIEILRAFRAAYKSVIRAYEGEVLVINNDGFDTTCEVAIEKIMEYTRTVHGIEI